MSDIQAAATRKSDGWAPTLIWDNGGRLVSGLRHASMADAEEEAGEMVRLMGRCPFRWSEPGPDKCIDLGGADE